MISIVYVGHIFVPHFTGGGVLPLLCLARSITLVTDSRAGIVWSRKWCEVFGTIEGRVTAQPHGERPVFLVIGVSDSMFCFRTIKRIVHLQSDNN